MTYFNGGALRSFSISSGMVICVNSSSLTTRLDEGLSIYPAEMMPRPCKRDETECTSLLCCDTDWRYQYLWRERFRDRAHVNETTEPFMPLLIFSMTPHRRDHGAGQHHHAWSTPFSSMASPKKSSLSTSTAGVSPKSGFHRDCPHVDDTKLNWAIRSAMA